MATADLPENATTEQRDEFIEQVLSETQVPDQEEVVEERKDVETPSSDEKSAGEPEAAAEEKGDEEQIAEAVEDKQDWLDDETRSFVSSLGISDEHLSLFSSRDELERALILMDASALQAGRNAFNQQGAQDAQQEPPSRDAPHPTDPTRRADGTFLPAVERQREDLSQQSSDADYKVNLDPEVYDEGLVGKLEEMAGYYNSRIKRMEQEFARIRAIEQQQSSQALEQQFDSVVDSLDHQDIFGVTGKETPEQMANRKTLLREFTAYWIGLNAQGRRAQLDKTYVGRVANMAFADKLSTKQRKQLAERLRKQSQQRMGKGSLASREPKFTGPMEEDPELLAEFARLAKEG